MQQQELQLHNQPNVAKHGIAAAGVRHGAENVAMEVTNLELVTTRQGRETKMCNTRWRRLSPCAGGDGQPFPERVVVQYDCDLPAKDGFFKALTSVSVNGAVLVRVQKLTPVG